MKRQLKPKPRNNGTMTEAAFWAFISNSLRKRTRVWKPINEVKKEARRPYVGENKRRKWEYECNHCGNFFSDNEVVVDHVIPVGSLRCAEDLPRMVETLFCEKDNLQCLCTPCHQVKTNKEREQRNK